MKHFIIFEDNWIRVAIDVNRIDELFYNSRNGLDHILRELNDMLFNIVYAFVKDQTIVEGILDDVANEFVRNMENYDPNNKTIVYELYLIAKRKAFEYEEI